MAVVKACKQCGEPFVAEYNSQKYCSVGCAALARSKHDLSGEKRAREEAARARQARAERLRRLAERNRETAKITVEERDGVRVETRGTCPCSSTLGLRRQYVSDKGQTYIV